jgi:hypothetical protein
MIKKPFNVSHSHIPSAHIPHPSRDQILFRSTELAAVAAATTVSVSQHKHSPTEKYNKAHKCTRPKASRPEKRQRWPTTDVVTSTSTTRKITTRQDIRKALKAGLEQPRRTLKNQRPHRAHIGAGLLEDNSAEIPQSGQATLEVTLCTKGSRRKEDATHTVE